MKYYNFLHSLIFLNFFTFFSADPQFNEFSGEFLYDFNSELNELYILNNKLELSTYELSTYKLKDYSKIKIPNYLKPESIDWNYIIKNQLIEINKNVGFNDLKLIKFNDNGFKLVHKGGGLIIDINKGFFNREDNSFTYMNKFLGDYFEFESNIFHFGGYGLFRSNNTLLKFDKGNSNQWDEVKYQNELPDEILNGISSFSSILIDSRYYLIGGRSSFNGKYKFNNSILRFDLIENKWKNIGEINLDLSSNPLILTSDNSYYIFDKEHIYIATVGDYKLLKFNYNYYFDSASILTSNLQLKERPLSFMSNKSVTNEYSNTFNKTYLNKIIYSFKPHNSKYGSKILRKYRMDEIIDFNSESKIPLLKNEQSRNQFFIPLLILISIIILNLIYKALKDPKKEKSSKFYRFENNELYFNETKIEIDNNSILILNMLSKSENVPSNDIVSALVKNGLSLDYASKIKNKVIESLNDKFNFLTSLDEPFIKISKSKIDKRIQVLNLLKI